MPVDYEVIERLTREEKSFFATTDLNSIGVLTEHDYLLLKNPSSSGKEVQVTHFVLGVDSASIRSVWRIYASPTITANGTALTITNNKIKASPQASVMECYKDPTISSRGNLVDGPKIVPANHPHIGVNRRYWIEENDSILVTIKNSITGGQSVASVYFVEI